MKPEWRPISCTRPTPSGTAVASTWAARMTSVALVNAVWKPKLCSMYGMSLSIVFGTPTTAMRRRRSATTSAIFSAPRIEPSPPMTNRTLMRSCSRQSTISFGSWLPRDVPRIGAAVLVDVVDLAGVRSTTGRAYRATKPWYPLRKPKMSRTP